jgi:2-dehydropantoate 2-reductase
MKITDIPTPALDAVAALVSQRGKIAGLYERNIRLAETKARAFA